MSEAVKYEVARCVKGHFIAVGSLRGKIVIDALGPTPDEAVRKAQTYERFIR